MASALSSAPLTSPRGGVGVQAPKQEAGQGLRGLELGTRESQPRGLGPSCCPVQGTVNPHTQDTPCPGCPAVVDKLGESGADRQTYSPASNLEAVSHRCPPGGPCPLVVSGWSGQEHVSMTTTVSSLSKASNKLSYEMGMTITHFNGGRSLQTGGDVNGYPLTKCAPHCPTTAWHPRPSVPQDGPQTSGASEGHRAADTVPQASLQPSLR